MIVYRSIDDVGVQGKIISVGSYDGVHLGHRLLIDRLNREADERNLEPLILTFDPHPKIFFGYAARDLSTLDEQLLLMEEAGARNVLVMPFTEALSKMEYSDFVKDILKSRLNVQAYVMGSDHMFGHNREGNAEVIAEAAIEPVSIDLLGNISSTDIRRMVENGQIEEANRLLGGAGYLIKSPVAGITKLLPPSGRLYEAYFENRVIQLDIDNLPDGVIRLIR